jgi:hypothetical protein
VQSERQNVDQSLVSAFAGEGDDARNPVGNFRLLSRIKSAHRLLKSMKNHNTGAPLTPYNAGFDAIIV